jgi:hypothetical protein
MAVFIVTVVIGILNGLDLVEFNHDQILTHVHSGTIGWISLSIVAAAAWLARGIDARLAIALAVLVPIYVAAFYLGNPMLRAVSGGLLLVAILWLVAWAWGASAANGTLPALAIALGMTTFAYGAVIGVLRQIQLANGPSLFPADADIVGAHASAMVFSYLILVAMGLIEWRLRGTTDRPRGGLVQVVLLFAGGLIISLTLLFLSDDSATQAAGGLYLLVELIAVAVFAVRILPTAVRINWMAASGERYLATSAVFVVVATAIFLYVIFQFISDPSIAADPGPIIGVLTASDHAAFIGVITNLMFGLLVVLTRDQDDRWSWAGQLVYWGVNIGLVVFLVGLIGNIAIAKQVGAPVMGLAILLALATFGLRLWASNLRAAEEG